MKQGSINLPGSVWNTFYINIQLGVGYIDRVKGRLTINATALLTTIYSTRKLYVIGQL